MSVPCLVCRPTGAPASDSRDLYESGKVGKHEATNYHKLCALKKGLLDFKQAHEADHGRIDRLEETRDADYWRTVHNETRLAKVEEDLAALTSSGSKASSPNPNGGGGGGGGGDSNFGGGGNGDGDVDGDDGGGGCDDGGDGCSNVEKENVEFLKGMDWEDNNNTLVLNRIVSSPEKFGITPPHDYDYEGSYKKYDLEKLAKERGVKVPGKGWPTCCPPKGCKADIAFALKRHFVIGTLKNLSGAVAAAQPLAPNYDSLTVAELKEIAQEIGLKKKGVGWDKCCGAKFCKGSLIKALHKERGTLVKKQDPGASNVG